MQPRLRRTTKQAGRERVIGFWSAATRGMRCYSAGENPSLTLASDACTVSRITARRIVAGKSEREQVLGTSSCKG